MAKALNVVDLTMRFDDHEIFKKLNFSLEEGSMTALLGPNGAGKTTLVRILLGMLSPAKGYFEMADDIRVGYVPQFRNIDPDYPLSIQSFIELNAPVFKSAKVKQEVSHILQETHLKGLAKTRMGEASGGQKQRAYLAQALLDKPNFIILDEATASLDPKAKEELMNLIQHLNREHGMTVLFVTHDIPLARRYMKDYLYLSDGTIGQGKMEDFKESFN